MDFESSPSPFAEPTGNTSGIDADQVLNQVEQGQSTSAIPSSTTPPPQASPQPGNELAFTWNGKEIKAPFTDPRVKQWAQQGYDYAQRMQGFNKERTEFEENKRQISELEARYKPVEDYYSKNPDRWDYVNKQYEALKNGLDPSNPISQKIQSLESKLSEYDKFIKESQQEKQSQRRLQEDQSLDQEIKSIRESYKDLDWQSPDGEGKNLEFRVLEHASKIGTDKFRVAFRDLHHDQLIKQAEERAKEVVVKEKQKQTKLGLLGQSSTPKLGVTDVQDIKNKSYDELIAEGMEELGLRA